MDKRFQTNDEDKQDQLVRQTIMSTQEDVAEIKEDIKRIEEKIDKLR